MPACDDRLFRLGCDRSPPPPASLVQPALHAWAGPSSIHQVFQLHPANLPATVSSPRTRTFHRLSPRTLLECLPRPKPAHRVRRRQSPWLLACAHSFLLRRVPGLLLAQPLPNRRRAGNLWARPERSLAPSWQNCLAHLVHHRLAPVIRLVKRPPEAVSCPAFAKLDMSPANFLPPFVLLADPSALAGITRLNSNVSGTLAGNQWLSPQLPVLMLERPAHAPARQASLDCVGVPWRTPESKPSGTPRNKSVVQSPRLTCVCRLSAPRGRFFRYGPAGWIDLPSRRRHEPTPD